MAAAILMLGFLGLIRAVTLSSDYLDTARKQQIAMQIASAEIEDLRGGAWSTIAGLPDSGSVTIDNAGRLSGDVTRFALASRTTDPTDDDRELCALGRGFSCSFTRTYLRPASASPATATFIKLVYTVSWTSSTGRTRRHQVDAFLTRNGLHLSHQQT